MKYLNINNIHKLIGLLLILSYQNVFSKEKQHTLWSSLHGSKAGIGDISQNDYEWYKYADEWYNRGDRDRALEMDKETLQNDPSEAIEISSKWYDRGEKQAILDLGKISTKGAFEILNKLILDGLFKEAEEYGHKVLEYWTSQPKEDIQKNIGEKLKLALKIEAKYYYKILKDNLKEVSNPNILYNYLKHLENLPLNPKTKEISIIDFLVNRTCIDPEVLSAYEITLEEARMMLELDLYENAKKNDILFSILHAIALHAKNDCYFKLHIFYNPTSSYGTYICDIHRIDVVQPLRSQFFRETIMHEWTHQLMDILFSNDCSPYPQDDDMMKNEWDETFLPIWTKIIKERCYTLLYSSESTIQNDPYYYTIAVFADISSYSQRLFDSEAIARFSEILAGDEYKDPRVQELLQPIYNYWMNYLNPSIERYIHNHAAIDTFISDWERERFLNPFYENKFDDEFKSDLKMVKGLPEFSRAEMLTNKWYNNGKIDKALELDKILINKNPEKLIQIANKWYSRGHKDFALELEMIAVQEKPELLIEIADRWYSHGDKDVAFGLDKIYAQDRPEHLSEIADKWYSRRDKDIALYFDKQSAQEWSYSIEEIADKWYLRRERDIAMEFDKLHIQEFPGPFIKNAIIAKWQERGEFFEVL